MNKTHIFILWSTPTWVAQHDEVLLATKVSIRKENNSLQHKKDDAKAKNE